MHEMGIANSILETISENLRRYPGHRVEKVGLRVGEYAGVDCNSLRFCLEALVKSTPLEPLEVEIEWCTVQGGRKGDELDMAYLELDDAREVAV